MIVVRTSSIVFCQKIITKITGQITPNRMDVIRIVLPVVILDEKGRSLDPIVVRFARLGASRPPEMDLIHARISYVRQFLLGKLRADPVGVLLYQLQQQIRLRCCHLASGKTARRSWISLP